ncbi:PilZ domain-containing protein [Geobacter pelophilus]|uniref:PilZ domain-containing protein n=1 Tax=Geoanaerobacter pelophilus TaxID=60036 RepID=A0AAW4L2C5_9BACT|nr:PilZ domain-containing protein [Geoanaerobacter pelophilus]MBT0665224.1 PilZ domain-containing protein [Geoanaerobacter pelophilus]
MEKRKFTRVPIRVEAFVSCQAKSFKSEIENLSLNGVCLKTSENLKKGDVARVTLYLVGTMQRLEVSISLVGTVLRADDGLIVVHFQEMDLDSFTQLRNIIAYNTGDSDSVMQEFINSLQQSGGEVKKAV